MPTSREIINELPETKPDAIQQATAEFNGDDRPNKVPLHIGVLKGKDGKDLTLASVAAAEHNAIKGREGKNTYVGKPETKAYLDGVKKFILGDDPKVLERAATVDAYGGTNALFLLQLFTNKYFKDRRYLLANDGWPNHANQLEFILGNPTAYYNLADENLDYQEEDYKKSVEAKNQPKVISLDHNGPHNGLGVTLKKEEWDARLELLKKKDGIAFFDNPYAGLGQGIEADLYPIRKAVEMEILTMVAHSDSKIKGAYDQRIGAALIIGANKEAAKKLQGVLNKFERGVQSFPAKTHLTFAELYGNPEIFELWKKEFEERILGRVRHVRELAIQHITHKRTKAILEKGSGMFVTYPLDHADADVLWRREKIMQVLPPKPSPTFGDIPVVRANLTGLGTDTGAEVALKAIDERLNS